MPAPRANGGAVAEVLNRWRDRLGIDDEFVANVATAGDVPLVLDGDPWRE